MRFCVIRFEMDYHLVRVKKKLHGQCKLQLAAVVTDSITGKGTVLKKHEGVFFPKHKLMAE